MKKKGFTLIELLIVVAIIGIIAAIAIPNLLAALQKGKQKATMGDMKSIGTAIGAYRTALNMVPNAADMAALYYLEPHFIKKLIPRDGWNFTWHYTSSGSSVNPDHYSLGSGGKMGVFTWAHAPEEYLAVTIADFEKDIIFCEGQFTYLPKN